MINRLSVVHPSKLPSIEVRKAVAASIEKRKENSGSPDDEDYDDEDYDEPTVPWFDITERYHQSVLKTYVSPDGIVSIEQSDMAVNTFVLVCALLLAIPFTIQGTLDKEFWDGLEDSIKTCNPNFSTDEVQAMWLGIYDKVINSIYGSTYSAVIAVSIAVMYYIHRPFGRKFKTWFKRGRYGVVLIPILTIITTILCLTLVGDLTAIFTNSSSHICVFLREKESGELSRYGVSAAVGIVLVSVCVVLTNFIFL